MPEFPIRKIVVITEEIFHEGGPVAAKPRLRAAAMALVKNPFAGRYVEELQPAMDDLKPLGLLLSDRLIERIWRRSAADRRLRQGRDRRRGGRA